MFPTNRAAYLMPKPATTLTLKAAPYTAPGPDQIVVKNNAIAMNPVDRIVQLAGNMMFPWVKLPFVIGNDVAGQVIEVGAKVTRFKVGDRVVGHAVGADKRVNSSSEGAFQLYTVLRTNLAAKIPDSLGYVEASVIPLGLSTAACGLFQKDQLALQYPTTTPKPTGQTLLVWGGSTSVGSNAIQLAVASGYEVIATSSPKNFDYCRRLGASQVFDYRSKSVVADVVAAMKGKKSAGAIAIGNGSNAQVIDIVAASNGRKWVAFANAAVTLPSQFPSSAMGWMSAMPSMLSSGANVWLKSKWKRVDGKFIFGSDLLQNEVGKVIYEDYLGAALAKGTFVASPEPLVVGNGLEFVQEAMERSLKGMSASGVGTKKMVVTL